MVYTKAIIHFQGSLMVGVEACNEYEICSDIVEYSRPITVTNAERSMEDIT